MTTPERPECDTVRLLHEMIEGIRTSPAVASGGPLRPRPSVLQLQRKLDRIPEAGVNVNH